jgi:hypothetical protein
MRRHKGPMYHLPGGVLSFSGIHLFRRRASRAVETIFPLTTTFLRVSEMLRFVGVVFVTKL